MLKRLCLLILLLFFTTSVSALYVGTAPGIQNHGTLERGDTYEFEFYITTDANRNFTITPEIGEPSLDFYEPRSEERFYGYNAEEASLEDIEEWISFPQETYDVNPDTTFRISDGGTVSNVQGSISYFLEVPRDAEPGYHAATINLNNDLADGGGSLSTMGLSKYFLVFRVPGEVERDLQIREVEGLRSGDNKAVLRYEVENQGTVTMYMNGVSREILDQNGQVVNKKGYKSYQKIAPGEEITIDGEMATKQEDLRAGNYRIRGNMNYITGQAFMDDTFSIEDFIEIESTNDSSGGGIVPSGQGGSNGGVPFWMVAMFLVLLGAVMYAFEIDPLLIIMALGVIGISAFVWISGLPMFLIGVVIIVSLVLFYYGWF